MSISKPGFRARNSVLFTPAASQEDITVLSSEESDLDISELGEKEKTEEEEDVRSLIFTNNV